MPSLSIVSLSKIHAAPTLYEKLDEPGSGLLVFRAFVRGEKKKNFPTRAPFLKLRRSDEFVLTAPSISIPIERVVSRNNFKIEKLGREGKIFRLYFWDEIERASKHGIEIHKPEIAGHKL